MPVQIAAKMVKGDDDDDDDDDDADDVAVETEANWSPTGQWHILCYSVTRCSLFWKKTGVH